MFVTTAGTVDVDVLVRVGFAGKGENETEAGAPPVLVRIFGNRADTGLPVIGVGGPTNCGPR